MAERGTSVQSVVKRLTGADLGAAREFLLRECYVRGKGFSSQYAGQGTVSCTTSAICIYALSETSRLSPSEKREFERVLLTFRLAVPEQAVGAFPRTTGGEASTWTTGQAALALLSLGATLEGHSAVSRMARRKTVFQRRLELFRSS